MTYCRELGRKTFLKKVFLDVPRKKTFFGGEKNLFLFFYGYYYYFSPYKFYKIFITRTFIYEFIQETSLKDKFFHGKMIDFQRSGAFFLYKEWAPRVPPLSSYGETRIHAFFSHFFEDILKKTFWQQKVVLVKKIFILKKDFL